MKFVCEETAEVICQLLWRSVHRERRGLCPKQRCVNHSEDISLVVSFTHFGMVESLLLGMDHVYHRLPLLTAELPINLHSSQSPLAPKLRSLLAIGSVDFLSVPFSVRAHSNDLSPLWCQFPQDGSQHKVVLSHSGVEVI